MNFVTYRNRIALTFLLPKKHKKTVIFPSIQARILQLLLNFWKLFLYYVGSLKKIKFLHEKRYFSYFFRKKQ